MLTADVRFRGGEVTIGVNGRLPKDRITIHIKASATASCYATFNSVDTLRRFELCCFFLASYKCDRFLH